jgi:AbrB family looped-hinge helix DNA binding protein
MEIAITKMSSKGQVVIPIELRKGLHEGDKLIVVKSGKQIIIKKATDMEKNLQEDIEFAKRTEEAWKSFERGEFKSMDSKDFLQEIEKW